MSQIPPSPQRAALQGAYAQAQGGPQGAPPGAPPGGPQGESPIDRLLGEVQALKDVVKAIVQKIGGIDMPGAGGPPPGAPPGAQPPAPAPRGPAGAPPNVPPR